jgi:hypothetical protein
VVLLKVVGYLLSNKMRFVDFRSDVTELKDIINININIIKTNMIIKIIFAIITAIITYYYGQYL